MDDYKTLTESPQTIVDIKEEERKTAQQKIFKRLFSKSEPTYYPIEHFKRLPDNSKTIKINSLFVGENRNIIFITKKTDIQKIKIYYCIEETFFNERTEKPIKHQKWVSRLLDYKPSRMLWRLIEANENIDYQQESFEKIRLLCCPSSENLIGINSVMSQDKWDKDQKTIATNRIIQGFINMGNEPVPSLLPEPINFIRVRNNVASSTSTVYYCIDEVFIDAYELYSYFVRKENMLYLEKGLNILEYKIFNSDHKLVHGEIHEEEFKKKTQQDFPKSGKINNFKRFLPHILELISEQGHTLIQRTGKLEIRQEWISRHLEKSASNEICWYNQTHIKRNSEDSQEFAKFAAICFYFAPYKLRERLLYNAITRPACSSALISLMQQDEKKENPALTSSPFYHDEPFKKMMHFLDAETFANFAFTTKRNFSLALTHDALTLPPLTATSVRLLAKNTNNKIWERRNQILSSIPPTKWKKRCTLYTIRFAILAWTMLFAFFGGKEVYTANQQDQHGSAQWKLGAILAGLAVIPCLLLVADLSSERGYVCDGSTFWDRRKNRVNERRQGFFEDINHYRDQLVSNLPTYSPSLD